MFYTLKRRFSSDPSICVVVIFQDENLETTLFRSSCCGTYDLWACTERTEIPHSRSPYMGRFWSPWSQIFHLKHEWQQIEGTPAPTLPQKATTIFKLIKSHQFDLLCCGFCNAHPSSIVPRALKRHCRRFPLSKAFVPSAVDCAHSVPHSALVTGTDIRFSCRHRRPSSLAIGNSSSVTGHLSYM